MSSGHPFTSADHHCPVALQPAIPLLTSRANPHFVIDAPGGGGGIPLLPEYVISMSDEEVVLRNFKGDRYVYR